MKLSKSKLALAKVINENGGWPEWAEWSCQINWNDPKVVFSRKTKKPYRRNGWGGWAADSGILEGGFLTDKKINNWHQCVLSREEYYQAYPKADADGWIEWNGGECPVDGDSIVDVEFNFGDGHTVSGAAKGLSWRHEWKYSNIIKYRPHKPEVKPELCESVMRSIQEHESIDGSCAKVTEENKHQHVDANPTIEQLAHDYRNKLDFAKRKQDEADKANMESDAALSQLEDAIAAIGFVITPLAATVKEPELVAAVKVGDQVECVESNINRDKYNGMVGRLHFIDESDTSAPYLVDFGGKAEIWCHEVKFIRRP